MTSVAIIPARGGSKRIPRKNIRYFEGKPIIAYCIETALESELFDEVMVSTEDDEIEDIAKRLGASVPFKRNVYTANDYATTTDVLLEVIREYEARIRIFDYGCCIYPAAPFITVDLLSRGRDMLIQGGFDSVFPVLRYSSPIQRALKLETGKVSMIWPEHDSSRSQDLPAAFHDAGQFYWFRLDSIKRNERLWTQNSGAFVISDLQAHDIDTLEDWAMAELKYRLRKT